MSATPQTKQVKLRDVPVMTHTECVAAATLYLNKRCKVVLPEFYSHNDELPDVIGFNHGFIRNYKYDGGVYSTLIECKISRGDFLKDKKKNFRMFPEKGMGDLRYYCCPKDLIRKEEVPEGWGLLYVYPSGKVRRVKGSTTHTRDMSNEFYLLYYYARRANYAGVHKAILEYRGFDK
jgi:hypothetical protein